MDIKYNILDSRIGVDFELPKYAKKGDAGFDLRAMIDEPLILEAGETAIIPTGLSFDFSDYPDFFGMIVPRSGTGSKGLVLSNTIGIIDSGYTGQIMLTPYNRLQPVYTIRHNVYDIKLVKKKNDNSIVINPGDRIAQMIMVPKSTANLFEVAKDEISITDRGSDGFGSSGLQEVDFDNETITEDTKASGFGEV